MDIKVFRDADYEYKVKIIWQINLPMSFNIFIDANSNNIFLKYSKNILIAYLLTNVEIKQQVDMWQILMQYILENQWCFSNF